LRLEDDVELCDSPAGASIDDMVGGIAHSRHVISCRLADLVQRGHLVKAGIGYDIRFFASAEAASAWAAVELPRIILARKERRRQTWRTHAKRQRDKARANGIKRDRKREPIPKAETRIVQKRVTLRSKIIVACDSAKGMSHSELLAHMRMSNGGLGNHLVHLVASGRLHQGGPLHCRGSRYFAEAAQAAAYSEALAKSREPKPKQPKPDRYAVVRPRASMDAPVYVPTASKRGPAFANAPIVIPPHVRVQTLPGCRVERFQADPSIAGRGVISQDYFARRQLEAA
jgi:hypothetical protein